MKKADSGQQTCKKQAENMQKEEEKKARNRH
jgi:hypothetical protein